MAGWWHPEQLNEAHNGYIEVYLNLGLVGVMLISSVLLTGYLRAAKAFRQNQRLGGLMVSYVVVAVAYNITEAGFRLMDAMWIFLLLAIYGATGILAGYYGEPSKESAPHRVIAPSGRSALPSGQVI